MSPYENTFSQVRISVYAIKPLFHTGDRTTDLRLRASVLPITPYEFFAYCLSGTYPARFSLQYRQRHPTNTVQVVSKRRVEVSNPIPESTICFQGSSGSPVRLALHYISLLHPL